MVLKALVVAGLVVLPAACSDDQENPQEAVELSEDVEGGNGMGMGDGFGGIQPPALGDIAGQAAQAAEEAAKAEAAAALQAAPPQGETMGQAAPQGNYPAMYVRSYVLRVRSGPGKQFATVGYVTYNSELHPLETTNNEWVRIGNNKFVSRNWLSPQKGAPKYIPAH